MNEFREHRKTIEYLTYGYDSGRQFVFYCWNIFSTIPDATRGVSAASWKPGRPVYPHLSGKRMRKRTRRKKAGRLLRKICSAALRATGIRFFNADRIQEHHIRGAPGTGKSFLAKEIATDIISNGYFDDYTLLTNEQRKQVELHKFHPSYDYTDFWKACA